MLMEFPTISQFLQTLLFLAGAMMICYPAISLIEIFTSASKQMQKGERENLHHESDVINRLSDLYRNNR